MPANAVGQEAAPLIERGFAGLGRDPESSEVVEPEQMRVRRRPRLALGDQLAARVRIDVRNAGGRHRRPWLRP